jgi:hypothetical protein
MVWRRNGDASGQLRGSHVLLGSSLPLVVDSIGLAMGYSLPLEGIAMAAEVLLVLL